MEKTKYSKRYRILSILFLIAYIGCLFVLTIESLTPGKKSAQKSNAVGNVIGGFINDLNGDQAKEIDATSCTILTVDDKRVFSVGEKINVTVETLPKNSTHKSYVYTSSDENIAIVSSDGIVSFIGSGEVTITATNASQSDIYSSISLKINDVLPESIESSIIGLDLIEGEVNYYELEKSKSYRINNILEPDNVTDKSIEYIISNTSCLTISNDVVYAKDISDDYVTITIKTSNDLTYMMNVKIIAKEVIEEKVEPTSINSSNITKYADNKQDFTPSITYSPKDTSNEYKGYVLQSENTNICTIVNNKIHTTGNAGICNIKIISTYDSSIVKTITVTVKSRSNVNNFDINCSSIMYVNDTQTITVKNIKPTDCIITNRSFESSDNSVIEVLSNGKIKAKSIGSATITVKVTDSLGGTKTKTVTISVNAKPEYTVEDFEINNGEDSIPIIYLDTKTNLKDYFKITKYYPVTPDLDKQKYYFSFDEDVATLDESNITINENGYGLLNGYMYYENTDGSRIYKQISIYALAKFNVTTDTRKTSYDLRVGDYLNFVIVDDYDLQQYEIGANGSSVKVRTNNKNFRVQASDNGITTITITPLYLDQAMYDAKYVLTFNVSDVYTTTFDISFKGLDLGINDDKILYVGKSYKFDALIDEATTKYNVTVNDNGLIERKFDTFTPKKQGTLTINFIEDYSGLSKEYTFKIRNYISINESKQFVLKGSYDYSGKKIVIINGDTLNLSLAFSSDTTYRKINYSSSDEKIIKVYSDGTIEPKKQGEATITLEVNDGDQYIIYTVDFVVNRKNIIDNMSSFMRYIRKGVGHFGAFLVLAIFATLTYAMFFRGKLYFVGVAVNFASGFLFAGFTEYLQTLTPQRVGCMSDILIDYSGYISSAIVLTVIFTTIFAIKFFKNKKKDNNEEPIEQQEKKIEE